MINFIQEKLADIKIPITKNQTERIVLFTVYAVITVETTLYITYKYMNNTLSLNAEVIMYIVLNVIILCYILYKISRYIINKLI